MRKRQAGRRSTTTPPTNTSLDPTLAYAKAVVAGSIVAGPYVRAACKRHIRDLKDAPARGLYWDQVAADFARNFFPKVLCLAGGQFEGQKFILQPSQEFIVGSLFGWKRADGTRRFRRAYIEEGKGNGKSPLVAGLGLYGMIADKEPRSEVYAAAAKKDQAMVMFRDAVAMVDQSPRLSREIIKSGVNPVWGLAHLPTASFFRPLSSDDSQSGPRPYFALCDELHEHKSRVIVDMLERGFKSRRQPLLVMITNSGSDRNSVCWEEHQNAIKVAQGDLESDDMFAYVCALDEGDDPITDPSCWVKANPLLNITVTDEYLQSVVRLANAIPGKLNGILRLHFCVWTDAEEAWMARSSLEQCIQTFNPEQQHAGERICIGLDLSASQDLTAMSFVVRTGTVEIEETEKNGEVRTVRLPTFDAWIEAWTPKDTMEERAKKDQAPYDVWAREGHLTAIPGKTIRVDVLAARLAAIASEFDVAVVAYDRYAFRKLEEACDELGLTLNFVEHPQGGKRRAPATDEQVDEAKLLGEQKPQGLWMPGSLNELEQLIYQKRIRLKDNPVLISACMSAVTEADAFDNRWFSKRKATNRIDAVVALAMGVGAATGAAGAMQTFSYSDFLDNAVVA